MQKVAWSSQYLTSCVTVYSRQDSNSLSDYYVAISGRGTVTNSVSFFFFAQLCDVKSRAERWEMTDSGEKWWTGGGRCCVGEGVILRNTVTLETSITLDNFDNVFFLRWFIQGKLAGMLFSATPGFRHILGAAQNNQRLESGASEHFEAEKSGREKVLFLCFIFVTFLTAVSHNGSIKFYWRWFHSALTDSKSLFICWRQQSVLSCYGGKMYSNVRK